MYVCYYVYTCVCVCVCVSVYICMHVCECGDTSEKGMWTMHSLELWLQEVFVCGYVIRQGTMAGIHGTPWNGIFCEYWDIACKNLIMYISKMNIGSITMLLNEHYTPKNTHSYTYHTRTHTPTHAHLHTCMIDNLISALFYHPFTVRI